MDKQVIRFISQWRVIVPLAAIVLGWFFWPQTYSTKVKSSGEVKTVSSTDDKSQREIEALSLFGTKKKLSCSIESATAIVDDTKISATLNQGGKKSRYVFDGDCLYKWIDGNGTGDRSCGLKSYIPILSQFVSNDSIQKVFPQSNELVAACKDIAVVDQKVFATPKTVLFKNKKLF